jgi:hypothetical protein
MKNRYGFQSNEMFEVGNPDLIRFNFDQSFIASHLLQSSVHYDSVMYIDNGLICSGLVFESENEFISHIISTSEQLKRFNKKLIFKPHPGHLDPFIFSNLENYGVKICDKDDFVSSLQKCSVAIVEPSTLAILPALTGMPILLASYGKLCNQHFGRLLTSYPKSIQINYLSDISESVLSPSINIDESSTKAWIEDNVGMLPASDMPNRVVNVVMDLIN